MSAIKIFKLFFHVILFVFQFFILAFVTKEVKYSNFFTLSKILIFWQFQFRNKFFFQMPNPFYSKNLN